MLRGSVDARLELAPGQIADARKCLHITWWASAFYAHHPYACHPKYKQAKGASPIFICKHIDRFIFSYMISCTQQWFFWGLNTAFYMLRRPFPMTVVSWEHVWDDWNMVPINIHSIAPSWCAHLHVVDTLLPIQLIERLNRYRYSVQHLGLADNAPSGLGLAFYFIRHASHSIFKGLAIIHKP